MISVAPKAPKRDDDRGVSFPPTATVEPYWLEEARKAFLRRYYDENGDDYEASNNVYGDAS